MATFEVFIPVQGEIIFTVEAANHLDAQMLALEMDFSGGEPNIEWNDRDEIRSEEIVDYGDDDPEFLPVTAHASTGKPYAMRHYRF